MRVGVIGAGRVGAALARGFCRAGFEVVLANRRGRVALMPLVDEVGSGLTPASAVEAAGVGIVVLAVPFDAVEELLDELAPLPGTLLVDATNAWGGWDDAPGEETSSQAVARWAPGARVVKALNTVHANRMAAPRAPDGGPLALPIAGDDEDALARTEDLVSRIGFAPVRIGGLAAGALMEPAGPLFGVYLGRDALRALRESLR